jgi:hypothetical protein
LEQACKTTSKLLLFPMFHAQESRSQQISQL